MFFVLKNFCAKIFIGLDIFMVLRRIPCAKQPNLFSRYRPQKRISF